MVAKYGEKQMAEWRKLGGRKKNPTLAEILAAPVKPTRSNKRAR